MADAVVSKKKPQGDAPAKWSIWMNDSGTLSFGNGSNNEVEITKQERDALKALPPEKRGDALKEMRKPAEPEKVEEPAPVDTAAGEPVVTATQTEAPKEETPA